MNYGYFCSTKKYDNRNKKVVDLLRHAWNRLCFLNNHNHLGLLSLIETSDRATTRLEILNFWQESTVYPRPETHHILKFLNISSIIDDHFERRSLINKLIEIALENEDKAHKKEEICVLAVKILIEKKLKQRYI